MTEALGRSQLGMPELVFQLVWKVVDGGAELVFCTAGCDGVAGGELDGSDDSAASDVAVGLMDSVAS